MPEDVTSSDLPAAQSADGTVRRFIGSNAGIRTGSRLGVWGLVGGFGVMTAFTLGAPISLASAIAVMGGGLLVSGLGTFLAATGVVQKGDAVPRLVRTAALAGVPLGAALSLLGLASLTQWGPVVAVVNAVTPAAAVLGALVVGLLVIGFFVSLPGSSAADPLSESNEGAT